jgi:hypothetical protein
MASLAAHEPKISPNSTPVLADALMPASIFAPDGGGCGDHDAGEECLEDGDLFNGETGDLGIDFTSKVVSLAALVGAVFIIFKLAFIMPKLAVILAAVLQAKFAS